MLIAGTPYVRTVDGRQRRTLKVQMPTPFFGPAQVDVVTAGESTTAEYHATGGRVTVDGPPVVDGEIAARITVQCAAGSWTSQATLPPTRLWTIYIAQDKHLDYGWIHPVEQVVERMNALVDYHLDSADRIGLRWNLSVSIWVEEFLRTRPSRQAERLLDALRSGGLEVAGFWLVPFPGLLGTEEVLQGLRYARHLEETFGIPVRTASLQEVPSLSWGYATILAGAGFPYVVKGAYHLRNPHLRERDPVPLAFWEGPDGERVLLRWDAYDDTHSWGGYAEAYTLWRASSDEERVRFIEDTVSRYEGYESYPFDAILLDGTGFDEYPQTTVVSDFVRWYNAQGWDYPRLVDATWSQFWGDIERQMEDSGVQVPVLRGDWGTTWEEWPAQLARLNTVYHRVRETVLQAQAIAALAHRFDPDSHRQRANALSAAWRGLLQFTDHNIGGITEDVAEDVRDRKATYIYTAAREGARALQGSLATIASLVPRRTADERVLLVANPNSWSRAGVVEVMVPESGPYDVLDVDSDQPIRCQLETRGAWPEHYLSFVANDVPSFGYRCFAIRPGPSSAILPGPAPSGRVLENRFYRLTIDPDTGGLRSLWDKTLERELVSQGSEDGHSLNQYMHWSDSTLHRPRLELVSAREGVISISLIVETSCLRSKLRTTYRLYDQLRRVDIVNALTKEPSAEPQASWFLFPFSVTDHQCYYDGAAAILRAGLQTDGGDLLPGSGRTCVAVQTFLTVRDDDFGITLATPDAHLVQFGEHILGDPLSDSDPTHSLILSLVMHNFTRNDHAVAQGGQAHFEFRYSILSSDGPFQGSTAVRFAKDVAQTMPATWVTGEASASLPDSRHAFLSVTPDNVVVTGLKVAEDGDGWVMRLWECNGQATEATIDVRGLKATRACHCDLLERAQESLQVHGGIVKLAIPARGLRAFRFA